MSGNNIIEIRVGIYATARDKFPKHFWPSHLLTILVEEGIVSADYSSLERDLKTLSGVNLVEHNSNYYYVKERVTDEEAKKLLSEDVGVAGLSGFKNALDLAHLSER